MIIQSLKLNNFRVFKGEHIIDLNPRIVDGKRTPIILFGGLNGAGKTSILSAIRLVLYGANSLGRNTSKRAYTEHLMESVHLPPAGEERPNSSYIELVFEHGDKGTTSSYRVIREWEVYGGKAEEKLSVYVNGREQKELSLEQCQSFLNELVPVGVADLFFFDGEKIADLAEDEGGAVLREAINRLMGVDIIHRLRNDLATYIKDQRDKSLPVDQLDKIKSLEEEYQKKRHSYELLKEDHATLGDELNHLLAEIRITERVLDERGGAWAASRKREEEYTNQLLKQRDMLSEKLRVMYSEVAPLTLAPNTLKSLLTKLKNEQEVKRQKILNDALNAQLKTLTKNLQKLISTANDQDIENAIRETFVHLADNETSSQTIAYDLSESETARITYVIEILLPQLSEKLEATATELRTIENELEFASRNVDRRPEESFLKAELDRLTKQTKKKVEIEQNIKAKKDEMKVELRAAMDLLRNLRKMDDEFAQSKESNIAVRMAANSRNLLEEFAQRTTEIKVEMLETEFIRSFQKLARKGDISLSASIDPVSFSVTLKDAHGNRVRKKQLSAGEKQIYAIAILEALGRTTGRQLPIIIDTPLGRLDSKHRQKLVHNYFPVASHQVIILSTDTEIDEKFFASLQDDISHGFEINYSPETRSSALSEGYFWRKQTQEAV